MGFLMTLSAVGAYGALMLGAAALCVTLLGFEIGGLAFLATTVVAHWALGLIG